MPFTNLGGIERPKDERDIQLGAVQAPVTIPDSYIPDMSWFVRNYQGQTPACGAHAATHLQAILERQLDPTKTPRYTPRYSWIKIKKIDGFPLEAGTDMRSIFKSLTTDGVDDYEPLEDDVTLPLPTYSSGSVITPQMDANAAPKRISAYGFGTTDFQSLRQAVYKNKAVLLLIKCDDGFWGSTTPTFTTPKYGHFVVGYGFDKQYIYIVDSADPTLTFKKIDKRYINPKFILESGTAIDLPPETVKQLTTIPTVVQPTQQNVTILAQIAALYQKLLAIIQGRNKPQ